MTMVVGSLVIITTLMTGSDAGRSLAPGQEKPAVQAAAPTEATAIRQRVKESQQVRVMDDQGREWHGRIAALTPDTLSLITKDRERRDLPYGTILRIDRPHDGLANGASIGLLSGAVLGLLAVISEETAECEPGYFFGCGDPTAAAYVVLPLITGGLGAAIGVGLDALISKESNLFRRGDSRVAIAPALGGGTRGVRVSVRW